MSQEPLIHNIYVNLSEKDRRLLEQIAEERGATLSGVIRKLIRDAGGSLKKGTIEGGNGHAVSISPR